MKSIKLFNSFTLLSIIILSFGLFISCSDDNDSGGMDSDPDVNANIVETATDDGNFDILVQAIIDVGLADALQGTGPFTVFAPTDDAFEGLPDGVLESLTTEQLAEILQFHVISGAAINSGSLSATQDVETLLGEELLVESNGGVTVNGSANVVSADVEASNGIIHAIDSILLPQSIRIALGMPNIVDQAVDLGNFTTLAGALEQVGLTTTLKFTGDYTVFAPNDDAFNALPDGLLGSLTDEQLTEILTYHVLSGEVFADDLGEEQAPASLEGGEVFVTKDGEGNVTINGSASVIAADVDVTNGVIHAIDQVILPDSYGTVVDAASKRYNFQTLVSAVIDAGLADALSASNGTFTVFAPNDDAFAALPEGLLESLTMEQLATILSYHVLPVEVASGDLEDEQAPASLTDEEVYVTVADGNVTVNGSASVVAADIATNNGTIHAIDEVILPNAFVPVTGIVSKNYNLSTLLSLVADREDVLNALADEESEFTIFAPTNAAFEAALEANPDLTDEQITEILTYHVLTSKVLSSDLSDGQSVETFQGENIMVSIGENVQINNATVTTVDLEGSNGVVHIIDSVLLPPSYTE